MRWMLIALVLSGCAFVAPVDAADPRFEACGGAVDNVEATVAFTARDYRDHFPLMGRAPELESDDQALAVVFAAGVAYPGMILPALHPQNQPAVTQEASEHRTVCIYVGKPPAGVMHVYTDVDVALLLP